MAETGLRCLHEVLRGDCGPPENASERYLNGGITGKRAFREYCRENTAFPGGLRQFESSAMSAGNPGADGQAKPRAASVTFAAGTGFVSAEESLENAGLEFTRNARTGILHAQIVRIA